jgi:hypothetical protein
VDEAPCHTLISSSALIRSAIHGKVYDLRPSAFHAESRFEPSFQDPKDPSEMIICRQPFPARDFPEEVQRSERLSSLQDEGDDRERHPCWIGQLSNPFHPGPCDFTCFLECDTESLKRGHFEQNEHQSRFDAWIGFPSLSMTGE